MKIFHLWLALLFPGGGVSRRDHFDALQCEYMAFHVRWFMAYTEGSDTLQHRARVDQPDGGAFEPAATAS